MWTTEICALAAMVLTVAGLPALATKPTGDGGVLIFVQSKETVSGTGVVIATEPDPAKWGMATITVDHEEIVDFMPAMEMMYNVKSPDLVEGLKPGDKIDFTIDTRDLAITAIQVIE